MLCMIDTAEPIRDILSNILAINAFLFTHLELPGDREKRDQTAEDQQDRRQRSDSELFKNGRRDDACSMNCTLYL